MRSELIDLLAAYLSGWKTIFDCAEWLAGVKWEDLSGDPDAKEIYGELELLVTEVAEGLRAETEFSDAASDLVARVTDSRYLIGTAVSGPSTADSSSAEVVLTPEFLVRRVVGQRSWNISPRLVSA